MPHVRCYCISFREKFQRDIFTKSFPDLLENQAKSQLRQGAALALTGLSQAAVLRRGKPHRHLGSLPHHTVHIDISAQYIHKLFRNGQA